jgi:hypothetical protein
MIDLSPELGPASRMRLEYLNAPAQRDLLYRVGIIVSRIKATTHCAADQCAPAELDAFMARLSASHSPAHHR